MRKTTKLVFSSVLLLILSTMISTAAITPAFAKNLNLPPGADKIYYFNAGGTAEVALPAGLPGFPVSATGMRFSALHVEMQNADISFDYLLVWLYVKATGTPAPDWYPFAVITTNNESAAFTRTYFKGSFVYFDATLYGAPASYGTNNVILLNEGTLTVSRHGNDITINLNASQLMKRPLTASTFLTLPAFTLELKSYGESIHGVSTRTVTGAPGTSGYTLIIESMGFQASGSITSPGSYLNGANVSNAEVAMKGTHTYYPPT